MAETNRKILAATFGTPDGASRAGTAIAGSLHDKVGNTAVVYVRPDGAPKFVESKDWGGGRGALIGGAIGLIIGPVGMLAGGGIGALAAKLRDTGFNNEQLEQLGRYLKPNSSALVVEIASDATGTAIDLMKPFGVERTVIEDLDVSVARLFEGEPEPKPEAEPAATARV
jgi:uncharacterized membrane protein